MLLSGVESLLDSSVSAVIEELYTGLTETISTELMAVSEPTVGLDAKSDVSTLVLAHRDSQSAEHRRTSGVENFCQSTEDFGDVLKEISCAPAESFHEELLQAGDLEENEKNKKRNFRKLDCSCDGHLKDDEEAQDPEKYCAESCAAAPGESLSKQEDPHLIQHEMKCSRTYCVEPAGPLKNTEENQANVQVTAETLPKLSEEVQGMKADGTRIFSKAGYRSDRMSEGLLPESSECSDIDTVMARAGVSETSKLDILEPLQVTDVESATEHPQETNEYNGLKAHPANPLSTGCNVDSVIDTREEELPRRNSVTEFKTSFANWQTYQQSEENNARNLCTGPVSTHNEPHRLSSIESCRLRSTQSSEDSYPVLQSVHYPNFRNMPPETISTAVHGTMSETLRKYLPRVSESQTHDPGTAFIKMWTFTSIPVEETFARSKGLSSDKIDHKGVSASTGKSYSSEFEEAAEVWRKITVGGDVEVRSWPEAQEDANLEHCHSSVFSSVASSPEEFSKEKFKMVLSEGDKLEKDQRQFCVSDLCEDDVKENRLLIGTSSIASHDNGQTDICYYNTSTKSSALSSHSYLYLSTELEKDSPEAQLLEKKSESNTTSEELASSLGKAAEVNNNDSLSTGKVTNMIHMLNVTLPPVTQKAREAHGNECLPCTVNEVSWRDKPEDNPSRKELPGASGTTVEQVAETVFHKNKLKSSASSRTSVNPNMTSKISQKDMKSSVQNRETLVTGLENEHSDTWNCKNQSVKGQCNAASTSCISSGHMRADDVLLNSRSSNVEVVTNMEENANSEEAPEGNHSSNSSERLLVRYLNKRSAQNYGFYNSPVGPKELDLSSLTATSSECSASICDTCPLLYNVDIQIQHASQTEKTFHPMENQCLSSQSEFDVSVAGRKKFLESLNNQTNSGLETVATSVEGTKISIGSSQNEDRLLKTGHNLPPLVHKHTREDSFQGVLKENVEDSESLNGVRIEDLSGRVGFVRDLTEENAIKLKECKNGCEREQNSILEGSFAKKPHCSQHAYFIRCAKEKGNKKQQFLPKMKLLMEDQENPVNAQFLPFSSVPRSLLCKPENVSETESKRSLRIKSTLNSSHPQLALEPGRETAAQKGIGPSHFGKFGIQEPVDDTQMDSETSSVLNLGISLPEKEVLCITSENTQADNHDLSLAKVLKDPSVTKPLSVKTSIGRKASKMEIPSSENEMATSFVNGAESSGVCVRSQESLRDEGHCIITVKRRNRCEEKFRNTCVGQEMEREVVPPQKLPVDSFNIGKSCLGTLLEYSRESGSKIIPLVTENYEKVLEEIPRSNLNNLSKDIKNNKFTNPAGTSLLSGAVCDGQTENAADAETSPELQYNTAPAYCPCLSALLNSCKESSQNAVVCSGVCVPYNLKAQSKGDVKEITEGQDAVPTHSVCKEEKALGSERLDQKEKHQIHKRKKNERMDLHPSGKARCERKSKYQEKAKITLQPSMLCSSELLGSSSNELVTQRNMKFEGPSEEISVARTSENKVRSTLQEIKWPKITTDTISSQILKTQDSEIENLNLNLGYDGIPGAFGTRSKHSGPLPLRRQPERTCTKVPISYQLTAVRKSRKMKNSPLSGIHSEIVSKEKNTLLKSLYLQCKPPAMETEAAMRFVQMPRHRAKRCSLLNSLKFRKCTKEPALLSKLSAMASKLLAPAKSVHNLEPLLYSSEMVPLGERSSQRRCKNLLEALSCINRNLHSHWADSWCTKMFSFQPLALFPAESTKILFSDLNHKPPTCFLDTPVFPISFHIKLDSSPVADPAGITLQHSVHRRQVLGKMAALPSEWTFSFLLSQSCSDVTAFNEEASLNDELHSSSSSSVTTPRAVTFHSDRGRNVIAERRGLCSMLGLHTVLALSSPGCYRIWTRRRNLTSRIPTIQRLFISQFAQGLKGARHPTCVSDDLVYSLPYSLGRVLSIWSQHGPSAHLSEITRLHSNHCKWQPSVGIENSYAVVPHLPVQSMEALQTAAHGLCLETSFPLPLPKSSSIPESLPSPCRLSASELQVHALDEADASVSVHLSSQDDTELKKTEPEKRPKKVSQIRIRKTIPKPDPNLTPMGLPKPKRLKKKEFSLEEIYTNKNYKSPPPARSLETIFEEPKEKNGRLISVSHQKRKRILEFQDFTLPRKRKIRGKINAVGSFTRAKKAAVQSAELDALLSQKLMDLEAFFAEEAEQEQASSI